MKQLKPLERDILKGVKDLLKLEGFFVIRNQQSMGSHPGMSDLTAIKNSIVLFIELKRESGRQSEEQIKFEKEILAHGGNYLLIRSVDEMINALMILNLGSSRLF